MTTGTKVAQDIKAGLKGIKGAGEAVRGGTLEATDELFDSNPKHPETQASKAKNEAIKDKGKADLSNADSAIGGRHGVDAQTTTTARGSSGTAAPAATGRAGEEYSSASNLGA